jgi:hypothetical protein
MPVRPSLLERAFELARSGEHSRCATIARRLSLEGYEQVNNHFTSNLLRKQLLAACHSALAQSSQRSQSGEQLLVLERLE